MKIEGNSAATLAAIIHNDIDALRKLDMQLGELSLNVEKTDFRDMAAVAYILHNLYNAFENSFEHISREFENNVRDVTQWHKELLLKMFLDIPGIRPAVLPHSCRTTLNELRGFRHVFRHSYDFDLDPQRLNSLISRWNGDRDTILTALTGFSQQLLTHSASNE